MKLYISCLVVFLMFQGSRTFAIDVIEFETQAERDRYQHLSYELRCPKCQNQNLTDSDSQISEDLREEVARLVREGKTDQEIKAHMTSLYGDFILYRPPLQNNTLFLWLGPVVMVGVGVLIFTVIIFRRSRLEGENTDPQEDGTDVDAHLGETVVLSPSGDEQKKLGQCE